MDGKAIMMCVVFLAAILLVFLLIRRIKKQMDKSGVEVIGTVALVLKSKNPEEGTSALYVYAKYCDKNGEEIDCTLSDAPDHLMPGQRVRLKYDPESKTNAIFVELMDG